MTNGHRSGLLHKRLDAFTRAAQHIDQGDVEAVHRTRVASRRLRELIPLLGLDSAGTAKLGRRVRKVTKRLGVVRELDVSLLLIQELGADTRHSPTALKHLSAVIQRDRIAASAGLAKLSFQKIPRLAHHIQDAAEQPQSAHEASQQHTATRPRQTWVWAAEARAARRAAGVRSAIDTAGTVYAPERLHDVRIAVKKLRYALELCAEARLRQASRDINVLKAAQDLLGRLHDLEVLIGRGRCEQAALTPPTQPLWHEFDSLIDALEDDCRMLHGAYMRDRPKLIAMAESISDTKKGAIVSRRTASGNRLKLVQSTARSWQTAGR